MPNSKPPKLSVAPEFVGLGRLANILKPGASSRSVAGQASPGDSVWTVFGVGVIWQTAAENAARRAGVELGAWLSHAITDAAATQEPPAQTAD